MQTKWINNQGDNLVLYFAGWGSPASAVEHLALLPNYDLLICYNYQNLQLDFDFSSYQQIHLVAWSMGVWVADQVMQDFPHLQLSSAVAINGTGKPCDDVFGIPQAIFVGTLQNLDETNLAKFQRRICGDKQLFTQYQQLDGQRSAVENQRELAFLYQRMQKQFSQRIQWTKAIIGQQDRIFPIENQNAYWQDYFVQHNLNQAIQILPFPHYPFAYFKSWQELY